MRRWAMATAGVAMMTALTACAGGPFVTSETCIDWVAFDTPADAVEDAAAAVIGTVGEQDGTTELYGYTANEWAVHVDEWVTGEGADEIRVVSTPATCTAGSPYPGGDPFAAASGPQLILLHDENGTLRAITPLQGIVPAPDGAVPKEWPPGMIGSPPAQ